MSARTYLALDLARTFGFAVRGPGGAVRFGSHKLRNMASGDFGAYLYEFKRWLDGQIDGEELRIVYEMPFVGGRTSQDVAFSLFGLASVLELTAHGAHKMCKRCAISDVRSHFLTGKRPAGRANIKAGVIAECVARGYDVGSDDDAADALALLDYALHCFNEPGLNKRQGGLL